MNWHPQTKLFTAVNSIFERLEVLSEKVGNLLCQLTFLISSQRFPWLGFSLTVSYSLTTSTTSSSENHWKALSKTLRICMLWIFLDALHANQVSYKLPSLQHLLQHHQFAQRLHLNLLLPNTSARSHPQRPKSVEHTDPLKFEHFKQSLEKTHSNHSCMDVLFASEVYGCIW